MYFSEYLKENIILEWEDKYINYLHLKNLIDNIIEKKHNSETIFGKELDKNWNKYYNFINELFKNLDLNTFTINDIPKLIKICNNNI